MNSNSAVATSAAAISGAMLGGVVVYLFTLMHIAPPPVDVAGTIGALLVGGGHAATNWLNSRFPAVAAPASPSSFTGYAGSGARPSSFTGYAVSGAVPVPPVVVPAAVAVPAHPPVAEPVTPASQPAAAPAAAPVGA